MTLPRDEAEHLTRVLRLGVGDDGLCVRWPRTRVRTRASIGVVRRDVRVQLVSRVEPAVEPAVSLTLAQAVIKGDKMDDIVRDAVMLGVAAVQPLVTARTEATVAALTNGNRLDRWRRVALASAKQSKRAVLPDVRRPLTLESFPAGPSGCAEADARRTWRGGGVEPLSALQGQPVPAGCDDLRRSRRRLDGS